MLTHRYTYIYTHYYRGRTLPPPLDPPLNGICYQLKLERKYQILISSWTCKLLIEVSVFLDFDCSSLANPNMSM